MDDCLFCRIARRELDADVVYETDEVMAFRDINPVAPTHVLVIPKRHIGSAQELTEDDRSVLGEMFTAITEIADREGVGGGYRLVTNIGAEAGQSVPHLHFHVLGGRAFSWPPG
ncbi:MAG TPA: histidine triad nucleotide-binding protein [Actinomycetota bacterium]|nr:histidine triad nucleotide-binding protein [Actinomycetota bacterium]